MWFHNPCWVVVLLSLLQQVAADGNEFHVNCSIPTELTTFASSPNVRGTPQILWTSLTTIVLCAYTALHLNIPRQRGSKNPGLIGDIRWAHIWVNLLWSAVTIIAPEIMVARTIREYVHARRWRKRFRRHFPEVKHLWTLEHMFYANMGGFVYTHRPRPPRAASLSSFVSCDGDGQFKEAHDGSSAKLSMSSDAKSVVSDTTSDVELLPSLHTSNDPTIQTLDCEAIYHAIEQGLISPIPPITRVEITDKSKCDSFTKVLAVAQLIHFSVVMITRTRAGYPSTQLEIATVAYAVSSMAVYGFALCKPKGVNTPTVIGMSDGCMPDALKDLLITLDAHRPGAGLLGKTFISNFHFMAYESSFLSILMVGVPLTSIHLTGWASKFPSFVDEALWKSSIVIASAAGPFYSIVTISIFGLLTGKTLTMSDPIEFKRRFCYALAATCSFLYILSRTVLLIEMFRCLFYLTPEMFKTLSWTSNFPHIG